VGNAGGLEECTDDRLVHKRLEVKRYLVKAKAHRALSIGLRAPQLIVSPVGMAALLEREEHM